MNATSKLLKNVFYATLCCQIKEPTRRSDTPSFSRSLVSRFVSCFVGSRVNKLLIESAVRWTGKVYDTTDHDRTDSGAVVFEGAKTSHKITLQSSDINEVSKTDSRPSGEIEAAHPASLLCWRS